MADATPTPAEQFDDLEQQAEAAHLGMWLFLGTEVLFFGGLFVAYIVYRTAYPQAFADASRALSVTCGAADTALLLISSFVMALAVHAAKTGSRRLLAFLLLGAAAFGGLFLALHGYEYWRDVEERHLPGRSFRWESGVAPRETELFYVLYFIMTGLHTFHVLVGVALLAVMAAFAWRGRFSAEYFTPVEVTGLYWHFVDVVWVFLFPLLYLVGHRTF